MRPEAIETDLRVSQDGVVVVFHDETVDRMTDGSGKVADLTWAELAELNIDGEHAADFPPQRVPRAEAFLDRYFGVVPLCLEIKTHAVIEPLVELLKRRGGLGGKVEFTSFEADAAAAIKKALPGAKVGELVRDFEPATIARVAAAGFDEICPWVGALTPEKVADAHGRELSVRTYGIKTIEDLKRAIDLNADGTTLNWPDWVTRRHPSGTGYQPVSVARKEDTGW